MSSIQQKWWFWSSGLVHRWPQLFQIKYATFGKQMTSATLSSQSLLPIPSPFTVSGWGDARFAKDAALRQFFWGFRAQSFTVLVFSGNSTENIRKPYFHMFSSTIKSVGFPDSRPILGVLWLWLLFTSFELVKFQCSKQRWRMHGGWWHLCSQSAPQTSSTQLDIVGQCRTHPWIFSKGFCYGTILPGKTVP